MSHQPNDQQFSPRPNSRRFTVAEPEKQEGLAAVMERGAIPEAYINRYYTDHDVPCAFCDNHTPHRRGFTARMADGRIGLCGRDCGERYFGKDAARGFERKLKMEEDNARRGELLEITAAALPDTIEKLKHLVEVEKLIQDAIRHLTDHRHKVHVPNMEDGTDYVFREVTTESRERSDGGRDLVEASVETGRIHQLPFRWGQSGFFWDALWTGGHLLERFSR